MHIDMCILAYKIKNNKTVNNKPYIKIAYKKTFYGKCIHYYMLKNVFSFNKSVWVNAYLYDIYIHSSNIYEHNVS